MVLAMAKGMGKGMAKGMAKGMHTSQLSRNQSTPWLTNPGLPCLNPSHWELELVAE